MMLIFIFLSVLAVLVCGNDLENDLKKLSKTKRGTLNGALKDLSDAMNSETEKRSSGGVPSRRRLDQMIRRLDQRKRSDPVVDEISEALAEATQSLNSEHRRNTGWSDGNVVGGDWGNGGWGKGEADLNFGGTHDHLTLTSIDDVDWLSSLDDDDDDDDDEFSNEISSDWWGV